MKEEEDKGEWVSGWMEEEEEKEVVGTSYCKL